MEGDGEDEEDEGDEEDVEEEDEEEVELGFEMEVLVEAEGESFLKIGRSIVLAFLLTSDGASPFLLLFELLAN